MKSRLMTVILAPVLLFQFVGCSFYLPQTVTFRVRDAETKQPLEGADIHTAYMTMLDFGLLFATRGPTSGRTDADGKLTLVLDPTKDWLWIDAEAEGYLPEPHMWGASVKKRLVPHGGLAGGSDFVLDMYKNPAGRVDLTVPDGYRGLVLVRFAAADSPPQRFGQRHFKYDLGFDGRVSIRESGLFERVGGYCRIHTCFPDGKELPTIDGDSPSTLLSTSLALRFITPVWEHHTWVYVLGTKAEADAAMKLLWGDGNHFNEVAFKRMSGEP